ncbi:fructosamine-3-kinase [Balneicella halophila]|uniref:Fructosamine-3-kinase n=1 Tax=Balneicella halophila TaxID=1537566 RepID=A0A7L4UN70_BALHA|nr:fructosamine kinase family protein [Balneicella halophila]PVX50006.1 fructosamine-3-kinase [Balneicella halophila]
MLQKISEYLYESCISKETLGGGSIADTFLVTSEKGNKYVVKTGMQNSKALLCEAHGLEALRESQSIRVPNVIFSNEEYLVIEFIEEGKPQRDFFTQFGRKFAKLHQTTSSYFGFFEDNFIGNTPQINTKCDSWETFYREYRLRYQLDLLKNQGFWTQTLQLFYEKLEPTVHEVLNGSEEEAVLLHGDLWSGNFMVDSKGEACIYDPAVYYGHREADLAMTKLFGGFSESFYQSYNEVYPLKEGWQYREPLYKLYHILNHVNLFGNSYLQSATSIIKDYLKA